MTAFGGHPLLNLFIQAQHPFSILDPLLMIFQTDFIIIVLKVSHHVLHKILVSISRLLLNMTKTN